VLITIKFTLIKWLKERKKKVVFVIEIFTLTTRQPVIAAHKEIATESIKATDQKTATRINVDSNKNAHYGDAVAQTKAEDLEKTKAENIDQLIKGRVAGLQVEKKEKINVDLSKPITSVNGYSNTSNTQNFFITPTKDTTQTAKNTPNDVLIIGYGAAKRKEVTGSAPKVAIEPLDSLMPLGGWQYYSIYMNQKIGFIGDTISNNSLIITDRNGNTLDDIEIEFSVDKHGSAYNVKVITDIDSTQAKTIANAVVEGPKWMSRKKKNKAKIPLKFP
jgi:hypothetical protein